MPSAWLVSEDTYVKTPPVGRRQPMTSEYIILFFVFTDWSVWSVHSGRNTVFLYLSWRALARRSRSVWIRVLVIWHPMTHTIVASFVWARSTHAMSLRGQSACIVSSSLWKKLHSRLSLFSRKEGQPSASRDSGPTATEARRRMKSWGLQVDLADELERELSLSYKSAGNEGEPLDYDDAISLTSSDPAASALLGYAQKEQEMSEGEEAETELSQTSCPAYEELLEVMEHATARLQLPWERTKMAAPPGRLDERYLSGHKPPAQVSLPFLPDLHTEVEREWKKPFSSRIHRFQHTSYANIARMRESGCERMPPVEETLASYLSMSDTASLKVPSLPFKPLQDTSRFSQQQVKRSLRCTPWWCSRHTRRICWKTWITVRACHLMGSWAAPHHGFGPPCHQAGCHCYGQVHGSHGGNGKASVGEFGRSSRCANLSFRTFCYLRRDGGREVQGGEGALSSLWNLHPKKVQIWARTKQGSWPGLVWGSETGTEG